MQQALVDFRHLKFFNNLYKNRHTKCTDQCSANVWRWFHFWSERPFGRYLGFTDISVSASVGVGKTVLYSSHKMLLYSSRMQTTCARKHNEPSQNSYVAATLAGAFSWTSIQDEPWSTRRPSQPKQKRHH